MRLITKRFIEELRVFWDQGRDGHLRAMQSVIRREKASSKYRYDIIVEDIGEHLGEYYIHAFSSTNDLLKIIRKGFSKEKL